MRDILRFCLDAGLMDQEKAERLEFFHERKGIGIGDILQDVDEDALYRFACSKFHCPLLSYDSLYGLGDFTHMLDREKQQYFHCLIIGEEKGMIQVLTWNFLKATAIPLALENLCGRKVELFFMQYTDFMKLST